LFAAFPVRLREGKFREPDLRVPAAGVLSAGDAY
jgi:hypothetical protein